MQWNAEETREQSEENRLKQEDKIHFYEPQGDKKGKSGTTSAPVKQKRK